MRSSSRRRTALAAVLLGLLAARPAGAADSWYPFPVEVREPPFAADAQRLARDYVPLERASRKWRICVSLPHLKDAYWLAVDYGLTAEATRLGVAMDVFEAGGYDNLARQIEQIRACVAAGAEGLIVGAISADGLGELMADVRAKGLPVIDLINGMKGTALSAKSQVSFHDMGFQTGRYLLDRLAGQPAKVAWFPGPEGAGWVRDGDRGFRDALAGSAVEIVATRHGDTGLDRQTALLEEVLAEASDIDVVAGTAVTAEAAIQVLRKRGLDQKVDIISYYFSPGVYRGIRRGLIMAAPSDRPAIQARIAVDQVTRLLEGAPVLLQVGPRITVVDRAALKGFDLTSSLAPKGFRIIFKVN